MKKTLSLLLACAVCVLAQAQWSSPDASGNIHNINTGFVGIGGVTNPTCALQVAASSNPSFSVGVSGNRANTVSQVSNSLAVIGYNNATITSSGAVAWDYYNAGTNPSWSGTLIEHYGTGITGNLNGLPAANQGELIFQNVSNGVIASNGANIYVAPVGNVSTAFLTNGSVGIGTTNTQGYTLAVNGNAVFTKAVVKLYANWPDYVFRPEYRLTPLDSVSSYIQANSHLPGIPSADSVAAKGLDLGDMQSAQLKKIEELTLYVIGQQKQLQEQAQQLAARDRQVAAQQQALQALEEKMARLEKLVNGQQAAIK